MGSRAEEVVLLLRRYAVLADQYASHQGSRHGIHRTDLDALAHLMAAEREQAPLTPTALADRLTLSRPATTALVDRLSAAGHAVREPDPADRRRTILRATPLARETGYRVFGPLGVRMRELMTGYSATDVEVVHRFLTEVVGVMQTEDDLPPEAPPPTS